MTEMLARDVRSIEDRFLELLIDMSGSKEDKQSFFLEQDVRVAKTNYEYMWKSLKDKIGRVEAAQLSVVFV